MDITSLYTVVPNGEGLLALKHFFDLRTVKEPGARFSKLPVITGPVKLFCFPFQMGVSKLLKINSKVFS